MVIQFPSCSSYIRNRRQATTGSNFPQPANRCATTKRTPHSGQGRVRETEVTGLPLRSCKIPIPTDAWRKGSARMTEDFERPDWVQQMEPMLETVNEGV